MEDKTLFGALMDMGAAHWNSYEETMAVYDQIQDLSWNVIVHNKAVYRTEDAQQASDDVHFFAKMFYLQFDEMFAMSVGKELTSGLVNMEDSDEMLNRDTIRSILVEYGQFLRENRIKSDDSYKERVWNLFQTDPKALRRTEE